MNPIEKACGALLEELAGKNMPLTFNDSNRRGVVFIYAGDDWEMFSEAIREAVDKVQEARLERNKRR